MFQLGNAQVQELHTLPSEIDVGSNTGALPFQTDDDAFAEFLVINGLADTPFTVPAERGRRLIVGLK